MSHKDYGETGIPTPVGRGVPPGFEVYDSKDGTEPLRCAACGGRIGGRLFTYDGTTAYHAEHDPDYVPPRTARTWWGRLLERYVR
jgi:hypothetical protein